MISGGDFEFLMKFYFQIFTHTAEMKKLKSGFLLKEILDRFTNKTQSLLTPDRSLWLYFAHDITITNMLNSLGLFKVITSCINTELFLFIYLFSVFIYSCINHRIHRVSSLNCTKPMTILMFKFSIKIPPPLIFHHLKFPVVALNVH